MYLQPFVTFGKHQAACSSQYLSLQIKAKEQPGGIGHTDLHVMRGGMSAAQKQHKEAPCKKGRVLQSIH